MKTIMIVPAKGFSRRIYRKNVRPFCGVPLVAWTVLHAVQSKHIDEVWVTTDDKEVADITERYGGKVMYRRYKDTDETNGSVPINECAQRLVGEEYAAKLDEDWCMVQLPTSPVMIPGDFDRMIEHFQALRVLSKNPVPHLGCGAPIRTHIIGRRVMEDRVYGIPEATTHNDYGIINRAVCLGVMTFQYLLYPPPAPEQEPALPQMGYFHELKHWQLQDVDTEEEWTIGEAVMEAMILRGRGESVYYDYGRKR